MGKPSGVLTGMLALIIQVFPHTEACNARSTRGLEKIPPFTRQVNLYTVPGWETPIVILPGQGENMVDSTHPPNPHP